ncbi:MAG: type II toxin-antitoxin system RelB/DinJ family antitoxin [Kiritimatiellae bacterium]|nr:type II toxin-antitoxin system RelB/DinJ family antitoxin [Kiritimatiellia bacterium]
MTNMTISLDNATKERFMRFCDDIGLSASSVITVYIKTVVRENRIPFIIEGTNVPNAETIAAMKEGDRVARDPNSPTYTDLGRMWEDLAK